jgi:hypothetical protein
MALTYDVYCRYSVTKVHFFVCRWREWCGLPVINSWSELRGVMANNTVNEYAALYEHPGDLDLWSAGISETPVLGLSLKNQ